MNVHTPKKIVLHKASRQLEVSFSQGDAFHLPAEYLRVHSPSAEVQGHGNPVLVGGKRNVGIQRIEPVGRYAVKLIFDDGHDTGLYSWEVLYDLGTHQEQYWKEYLDKLAEVGMSRDSEVVKLGALQPKKYSPPKPGA